MKKFIFIYAAMLFALCSCNKEEFEKPRDYGTSYRSDDGIAIDITVSQPNSVGGVVLYTDIQNFSGRTIKYVHIEGHMTNVFGDKVYDEISGSARWTANITGPIHDMTEQVYHSTSCFYNWDAREFHITYVSITYLE